MNERRQDSGRDRPRLTDKVDGWLRGARNPALVIAPGEATLIAANAAGAQLLGFDENLERIFPLDSAMPAVMELRRAVNKDARGQGPVLPLVFWTPDGIARLQCHIEVVDGEGGERLVLVEVASQTAPATAGPAAKDVVPLQPALSGEALPRDEPSRVVASPVEPHGEGTVPAPALPGNPPPITGGIARPDCDPTSTEVRREVRQSPSVTKSAVDEDAVDLQAMPSAPGVEERRRPSPPPHHAPRAAAPPPRPSAAAQARSDDETLKAIARQILAGRRAAAPKSTESVGHKSTAAPPRPNGTATPPTHGTKNTGPPTPATHVRPTAGEASGTAPASKAAATHNTSRGVRRSEPAGARAPSKNVSDKSVPDMPPKPDDDMHAMQPLDETDRGGGARPTRARRVAHELKTPLSAIVSAAEVMKDQRLGSIGDDRYLRYARDIYESARHALAVIERMLGQPRKDAREPGVGGLSFTDLDLNALAAGLLSGLEAMAGEAGLTLTSDLAPRLPLVVADATSVRQIMLNLLTNSLKFTPRGGQVLLVTRIDEKGRLAMSVSDTGPGISMEVMTRLAGPSGSLATAGAPQQPPGGGLGIGLPLAQTLASANGASLLIAAREGGGTLVTLAFPPSRQVPI